MAFHTLREMHPTTRLPAPAPAPTRAADTRSHRRRRPVGPQTIDATGMLEIHEFGPFGIISTGSHLQLLVHVVLALRVQGPLGSSAGVTIKPTWNEMASDDEGDTV
ncbi:hypothetical protein OQA88_12644 [Cercophora sp. LCS_1]